MDDGRPGGAGTIVLLGPAPPVPAPDVAARHEPRGRHQRCDLSQGCDVRESWIRGGVQRWMSIA